MWMYEFMFSEEVASDFDKIYLESYETSEVL